MVEPTFKPKKSEFQLTTLAIIRDAFYVCFMKKKKGNLEQQSAGPYSKKSLANK